MVDPRYPTNRYMVLITTLAAVGGGFFLGKWTDGLLYGAGFFMTWALAREFDPVHDLSAFLSGAVYLLILPLFDGLALGPLFLLLLLHRLLTRICGKEPTVVDAVAIVGLLLYLSVNGGQALYPLIASVAFLLAYVRYERSPLWGITALLAMAFSIVALLMWGLDPAVPGTMGLLAIGLPLSLLSSFFHYRWTATEEEAADDRGGSVPVKWVRLGIFFYALVLFAMAFAGDRSVATLWALQSVPLGVAFYGVLRRRPSV
jgi:hypothetical protein